VTVGGAPATGVSVVNATTITATTPAGVIGPADVTVTNLDAQSASAGGGFLYRGGVPTLSAIAPVKGSVTGGTAVTLTGANFATGATVTIGGAPATGVVVASAATITATTPAGTLGAQDVVVANVDFQSATLANGFLYQAPPPTLAAVSPGVGPLAGGTAVTLTGTNFQAGATVTIGGTPATGVVVASPTTITAITPAGTQGPADVVVDDVDAQSATRLGGFVFQGPVPAITGVSPAVLPLAGGTVTITGTDFVNGVTVTIGSSTTVGVVSGGGTVITATLPAGAIGPASVVVTNIDGLSATWAGTFVFQGPLPTLSGVVPATGQLAGGTPVIITGSGFAAGAVLTFAGVPALNVSVVDAATISATAPAGATLGQVTVAVANVDGQSAQLPDGYAYADQAPASDTSIYHPHHCGFGLGASTLMLAGALLLRLAGSRRRDPR
jgi:hypothetical protein